MKNNLLSHIKDRINEANPSIKQWNDAKERFLSHCKIGDSFLDAEDIRFWNYELHRHIMFSHVMFAIKYLAFKRYTTENKDFAYVLNNWDFIKDDLQLQNDKIHKAIYNLICK